MEYTAECCADLLIAVLIIAGNLWFYSHLFDLYSKHPQNLSLRISYVTYLFAKEKAFINL